MTTGANMKKILIVEDESIIAFKMKVLLEINGYEVVAIARNCVEALSLFMCSSPDLVLMDINLEGEIDGIMTAKQIGHKYNTPVIFVTAICTPDILERAKEVGPYSFLVKPYNDNELLANVAIALSRAQNSIPIPAEEQVMKEVEVNQFLKNLGSVLKSKRKERGLNQIDAANKLSINYRDRKSVV